MATSCHAPVCIPCRLDGGETNDSFQKGKDTMAKRRLASAVSYVAANRGNVPALRLVLGVVLVGFFLLALLLQIQTSEAFILSGTPVSLAPNWGILSQPVALVQGQMPMNVAKAVMWGWGIELV